MQSIVEGFTKEKKEQKSLTMIKKKLEMDTDYHKEHMGLKIWENVLEEKDFKSKEVITKIS